MDSNRVNPAHPSQFKRSLPSSASRVEKSETQTKQIIIGKVKGRKVHQKPSQEVSVAIPKAPPTPSKSKSQETTHPRPLEPFERQLQRAGSEMKLRTISKQIEHTSVGAKKQYEFPKMPTDSQNPLAKIGGPQFISKQALSIKLAAVMPLKYDEIIHRIEQKGFKDLPIQMELDNAISEFKNIKDTQEDAQALKKAAENLKKALEEIAKLAKSDPIVKRSLTTYFPQAVNKLNALIEELSISLTPISLEGVSHTFYNKDEVLALLRINMDWATEDQKDAILKTLEKVKSSKNQFIEMSTVQALEEVDLSALTPYVSTSEFVAVNNNLAKAAELIQEAAKETGTEFVFKTGMEITREILAGKLISSLGLSKPLVPKSEITFIGATFDNKVNPEGITSQLLEERSHYDTKKWGELMTAKRLAAESEFLMPGLKREQSDLQGREDLMKLIKIANQSQIDTLSNEKLQLEGDQHNLGANVILKKINKRKIQAIVDRLEAIDKRSRELQEGLDQIDSLIQKEQKRYNKISLEINKHQKNIDECKKATQDLIHTENLEGIEDHALTDMLFCAYDQHIGQYMLKDGVVQNIDFARFMAQHEAFTRGGGGVFLTFRSTFIDHPLAEKRLPDEKIQTILSWYIKSIKARWKQEGLIGDSKTFDDAQKKLDEIRQDSLNLEKDNENTLKIKCKKYGCKEGSIQQMQDDLKLELQMQYAVIKKQCYSHIHPQAFKAFKKRLLALQSYVADCQAKNRDPTLKGAFAEMYPLAAPFMKVLERLDRNPGESIGFTRSGGSLQQRSLNSIITEAETKKLASPEELQAMKVALAIYQKEAPPSSTLAIAMDLS